MDDLELDDNLALDKNLDIFCQGVVTIGDDEPAEWKARRRLIAQWERVDSDDTPIDFY